MKKIALLVLGLTLGCNSSQKTVVQPETTAVVTIGPETYAGSITSEELKTHLYTYASDEFEGRETGTPGQKKAVAYLKEEYQKLGIPAAKGGDNYFQKVPLEMMKLPKGSISFNGEELALGKDFLTFSANEGNYDGIVYVGYGIEEGDYSDYSGLDVEGKVVLVKAGEPKNEDGSYTLSGSYEASIWSNMSEAIEKRSALAKEKGAVGMFYFDSQNYPRFKRYFDYMKRNNSGQMSLKEENEEDYFQIFLTEETAKKMMADILTNNTPQEVPASLNVQLKASNSDVDSENVVALLKGSTKPDEYVVISSHLDHIGVTADGQINNGADDDGSGTVALLEIAEAFKQAAQAGNGPARSIVFLHVTGEEKGLLGSQYYTDREPLVPLEKTVANLNIDMIGRIDPKREGNRNYVYLIGSDKLSTDLHELSEAVNKKYMNIELDYTYNDENDPNRFYYRSDHYNFAKNNIPIIFYFNGTHDDYHRPGDTPDKINYDLLENRTRLIFHTAWEVANRDARVVVDKATR
ncbi:M28 family peptidase [Flavobacteriaceae bacterium TP-CH-4]|uniref:M28 family peptidase n=1 Tax=Pelagihabitans pacificus TaxID=2696054 RepID=A0A967ATS6_9FLAO|nr:M28 family metallopeptidase [Pelagihabitans pacificus]NHF60239.1 M28 family peptidase [Pelagihabitans pacificus]